MNEAAMSKVAKTNDFSQTKNRSSTKTDITVSTTLKNSKFLLTITQYSSSYEDR